MDRGALQHALEARGGFGVLAMVRHEVVKFVIDIGQDVAAQPVEVHAAGSKYRDRVLILGQRQQQMFEGGVFMPPLICVSQGPV